MWLLTNFGFFSVVQKEGDEGFTIRARVRKDLELLKESYLPDLGEIRENAGTDYKYRANASRESFADALKRAALDIDYPNFKISVAQCQGQHRAHIYSSVWTTLYELQMDEV